MKQGCYDLKWIGSLLGHSCPNHDITHVTVDSRQVTPFSLFFAIKGNRVDGHDFLEEVASRGAKAAVVHTSYQKTVPGLILIPVDDVLLALQNVARSVQKMRSQIVIAVTGSVGKTTTKEFIATLLAEKYTVFKTPGNQNSQIGLALSILNSNGKDEVCVVEMGMSRKGEIQQLTTIIPPHIAVITKIGYSHTDTVDGGLDGIAEAKAEILSSSCITHAVIEYEAAQYLAVQKGCPLSKTTFSLKELKANYCLHQNQWVKENGILSPSFTLPFMETHLCENLLGAVALARAMNLSWEDIFSGMSKLKPLAFRFEKIWKDGVLFINDSYNASLDSVLAALHNLSTPHPEAKVIAVLSEMVTLGPFCQTGHQQVGQLALEKATHLLCLGSRCQPMIDLWKENNKRAYLYPDFLSLKTALFQMTKPNDTVLIKGANQYQLWKLLEE